MAVTKSLPGYPSPGARNKQVAVVEIVGPTLYVPATGQVITAAQFGFGGFDYVGGVFALSESGTYYLGPIQYLPVTVAASQLGDAVPTVSFHWFVTATNLEAGAIDLSGEVVRVMLIMV